MDPDDQVDPVGQAGGSATRTTGWLWSLAKALLVGAAVLGACVLILWVVIGILLSQTMGRGELGSVKSADAGAYEPFNAAHPLVIRVLTATVDPALDRLKPGTDRIKSATVSLTLPLELTMSIAAVRVDGDRVVNLREESRGRFRDDFPSTCLEERCSRTYALVACWTTPSTGGGLSAFMGGSVSAGPAAGTSPVQVTIRPDPGALPAPIFADLAAASGCQGGG